MITTMINHHEISPQRYAAEILDNYWDDGEFPIDPIVISRRMGYTVHIIPEDNTTVAGVYSYQEDDNTHAIAVSARLPFVSMRLCVAWLLVLSLQDPEGSKVFTHQDAVVYRTEGGSHAYECAQHIVAPDYLVQDLSHIYDYWMGGSMYSLRKAKYIADKLEVPSRMIAQRLSPELNR